MKKSSMWILLICIVVGSCNKEADYQKDIAKKWSIEEYDISGIGDILRTTVYDSIRFEIDEGGDFRQLWYHDISTLDELWEGTWSVSESVLYLDFAESTSPTNALCGNSGGIVEQYDIVELSDTRLVLSGICNQRSVEIVGTK